MVFVRGESKKGQVTLFIILAIIIVAGILLFVILKNNLSNLKSLDRDVQPIYDSYLGCIESSLEEGIKIMAYQGGYIYPPEFVPGSLYRPTSSQLDFFGQPVTYWYYVSGNNIIDEQVPTKKMMEEELAMYIWERLTLCDLREYSAMGYTTYIGEGGVDVKINENSVEAFLDNSFNIYGEEKTYNINSHSVKISSKLGKFYKLALETFEHQKQTHFLEEYTLDVLWATLPVVGVEFGCAPLVFVDEHLRENLSDSLVTNIASLKLKGNYYNLHNDLNKYFVVDLGINVDENVNFMYSSSWPTKIDIDGERVIKPLGLQQGSEILGFCYAPYHLVYSIDFPVLVQFFDEDLLFQFPVVVIIQNNEILNLSKTSARYNLNDEVCANLNNNINIYTYDSELNPIKARLRMECMGSTCEIGSTEIQGSEARFEGLVPGCINGKIIASADGYLTTEYIVESPDEKVANIVLPRLYELEVSLNTEENSIIYFEGDGYSNTINYPSQKKVKLAEGYYNVSVVCYSDTNIQLTSVQEEICVDVPMNNIGGALGLTQEQCYKIEDPITEIDTAVVGAGNLEGVYITESELKDSTRIDLIIELFEKPHSLEDLQKNYLLVDATKLWMEVF